jgi:hypothetical protein
MGFVCDTSTASCSCACPLESLAMSSRTERYVAIPSTCLRRLISPKCLSYQPKDIAQPEETTDLDGVGNKKKEIVHDW